MREILRPFNSNMAREMKENHIGSAIAGNLQKVLKCEAPDVVVSYAPLTTKYLMKDGLCQAPVITMIHEDPSDNLAAATRQVKQCLDECAAIQLLLEYGKSIVRRDIAKAPIFIIPNCVPQYDGKREYGNKSKYTIVNVAGLDKIIKRQHIILEAFALLKDKYSDWQVELWGPGSDGKYAAELKRIIAKHNLQDKAKICGATDDVKSVLLRSDIFAFPSKTEAFSLALGEAMSAGLPVVGMSACLSVKSLLRDGKIGLLSEDNAEDFSRKLAMLMDNAELRRYYGEAGRVAVRQYAPERIWDQWDLLIKKVAERDKA